MDTTAITTDALMREINALIAECAATDARVDALLATPVPIHSIAGRIAALRDGIDELAAETDALEREQAEIERQIEALERDA
jgi:phage-related minor tail protein